MVKNSILPPMYANFYFNMLVYVGGLEYCTPNCTVCVLVLPSECEGKIIYCTCYMTSVRSHQTVCVT